MFQMLGLFSEFEAAMIRERVRMGVRVRRGTVRKVAAQLEGHS
jgi:DNA invertase Pin-like site-specific DNA recombinase